MPRRTMTGASLLCCAALLTACARPDAERRVAISPPLALTQCPAAPQPPDGNGTQRDVALYVIALHAAHGACRDRLRSLRELLARLDGPSDAPLDAAPEGSFDGSLDAAPDAPRFGSARVGLSR